MTPDSELLLRIAFIAGAVVDAGAAVGMAFPDRFAARSRFTDRINIHAPELRYGMRYGAPLMAGWTVLLIWACFDPLARRDILPITIVPVIAGLMLNDLMARRRRELNLRPLVAVRVLQLALVALFLWAYLNSS
jgi:hypothetical protein